MPYEIGDTEPPHIDVHNALNAEVAELSTRSGIPVVLPPIVSLGDTGHVNDHNLYTTAIQKIADGIGPTLEPAPIVTPPTSTGKPGVTSAYVRDTQGTRLVAYVLPGDTGAAYALALTEEGAAVLAARRDVLDAIAATEVPNDFEGDPVTLLPKKLRAELKGFIEVRATAQPPAEFSVTLGAGVFPGVIVGAGGPGGYTQTSSIQMGGGGAGGVIGQGANVPVILPAQGDATYTITVASTSISTDVSSVYLYGQSSTIAQQGQASFNAAVGGGGGNCYRGNQYIQAYPGASGGGGAVSNAQSPPADSIYYAAASGIPGQGNPGGSGVWSVAGGGGGYSAPGEGSAAPYPSAGAAGGAGFDLAAALNLDATDPQTKSLLSQVSADGRIAGGGSTTTTDSIDGGGARNEDAMDFTGAGGGGGYNGVGGNGAAGMAVIIGPA